MSPLKIKKVEEALRLHINYKGIPSNGKYLEKMDNLAWCYSGAPAIKVSKLCNDYYQAVGVKNLDEALTRLRKIDNQ